MGKWLEKCRRNLANQSGGWFKPRLFGSWQSEGKKRDFSSLDVLKLYRNAKYRAKTNILKGKRNIFNRKWNQIWKD